MNKQVGDQLLSNVQSKIPIVYSPMYDISFGGLERVHPFDAGKWGKIIKFLIGLSQKDNSTCHVKITMDNIHQPSEATTDLLALGHSEQYLKSLKRSVNVARIVEVFFVALIPNYCVNRSLLRRFRYHVQGTVLAAELAIIYKWAINVGGGFHHASENSGGGFCVYADISIAIKKLRADHPDYKFMIVDLDAHQGNGHERDFIDNDDVYIFDMYNRGIYPHDNEAKRGIKRKVELMSYTTDVEYIEKLKMNLKECLDEFTPDLIIYNAGTDCLADDPLGRLDISAEGIIKRDEIVFQQAKDRNFSIVMVTSGGYQRSNAEIIAKSIWNLFEKKIIEYDFAKT